MRYDKHRGALVGGNDSFPRPANPLEYGIEALAARRLRGGIA